MKCEICRDLLEEYLDAELDTQEADEIGAHLITCVQCSASFAALTAEQEMFARYDREIEVPSGLWDSIAVQVTPALPAIEAPAKSTLFERLAGLFNVPSLSFAGAAAVLLLALMIGAFYLLRHNENPQSPKQIVAGGQEPKDVKKPSPKDDSPAPQQVQTPAPMKAPAVQKNLLAENRRPKSTTEIDHFDVLSSDPGYQDLEDQDTAKHLEQTQNLLRSIRNVTVSDSDDEIDVTYDKALSRRLLNENIVLRRDAEMKAKFPTKTLLSDLEPILIDIANLPDQAKPEDVRVIKERVQKTEIVAELLGAGDYR
jgi:hypothetical protein